VAISAISVKLAVIFKLEEARGELKSVEIV
jgi:hypothetical protein